MMFMLPLNFGNVHNASHTNEIYKKSYSVDKINPKLGKIIIFRIMDLKCHINSIKKSFVWHT